MYNDKIIEEYSNLIYKISKKFYNVEKEDLYQAGCLGLIKAYNNYNEEFGDFSKYAYKYIFGEMYELSTKCRNIKVNKYYLKLYKLIVKSKALLTQQLEKEITNKDIADYLKVSEEEIDYVSLIMGEWLELENDERSFDVGENIEYLDNIIIKDSIDKLDTLSSKVIKYRYYQDYTQEEISKILGISQVKVSRLEKNAKQKILEYIS